MLQYLCNIKYELFLAVFDISIHTIRKKKAAAMAAFPYLQPGCRNLHLPLLTENKKIDYIWHTIIITRKRRVPGSGSSS